MNKEGLEIELKYLSNLLKDLNLIKENTSKEELRSYIWEKCSEIQSLIYKIEWELKNPFEKQAYRIHHIGITKKHLGSTEIENRNILFYEKINETIPYILSFNESDKLGDLMKFCKKVVDLIDSSPIFIEDLVSSEEIEIAFKPFFKEIKMPAGYEGLTNHPESEKKVEDLYELLKKSTPS